MSLSKDRTSNTDLLVLVVVVLVVLVVVLMVALFLASVGCFLLNTMCANTLISVTAKEHLGNVSVMPLFSRVVSSLSSCCKWLRLSFNHNQGLCDMLADQAHFKTWLLPVARPSY